MAVVRELVALLGLDFEGEQFLKAELAFEAIHKAAELLFEAVEKVTDAMVESVVKTAETAEELEHLHAKTDISVEDLQELGYVAERAKVSTSELAKGIQFLGRNALEASKGNKDAVEAFAELGVSIHDQNGHLKDGQELFLQVGQRLKEMPNQWLSPARAMKLFGRAGADLIPIFAEGSEGIAELREQARDLGLVMSEDMVHRAAQLNGVLEQLKAISSGLTHDFAGPFLDAAKELGDQFLEWFKANRAIIRTRIEQFAKALIAIFRALGAAVKFVVQWFDALLIGVGALTAAFILQNYSLAALAAGYASAGYAAVVAGIKAAAAWVAAAAPVVLLAALLAALVLAADDVYTFLQGGDSVIGDLGRKWTQWIEEFTRVRGEDPWWLQIIKLGVKGLTDLKWALDQFANAWTLFNSSFNLGGALGGLQTAARTLIPGFGTQDVSGSIDPTFGLSVAPSLPSSTAAAGAGGVSVSMPISVQVGPDQSPHAVAEAVGAAVDEKLRVHFQETQAATR